MLLLTWRFSLVLHLHAMYYTVELPICCRYYIFREYSTRKNRTGKYISPAWYSRYVSGLRRIVHGSLSTSSAQQLSVPVLHIRMLAIHFIPECFLHLLQWSQPGPLLIAGEQSWERSTQAVVCSTCTHQSLSNCFRVVACSRSYCYWFQH